MTSTRFGSLAPREIDDLSVEVGGDLLQLGAAHAGLVDVQVRAL
jgi:hypothetical protein